MGAIEVSWWLLAFVATYKVGEEMATKMFGPFLVRQGHAPEQVATWLGTWVMVASLSGSFFGSVADVREGAEAWLATGVRTLIVVVSSTRGGQMVALEELIRAFQ